MSVIVVAEFPMTEQGAQDFIDWSKGEDGYAITRQHKGFEDIRTFLAEDKKTIYLYEKWDSKEDHQGDQCPEFGSRAPLLLEREVDWGRSGECEQQPTQTDASGEMPRAPTIGP